MLKGTSLTWATKAWFYRLCPSSYLLLHLLVPSPQPAPKSQTPHPKPLSPKPPSPKLCACSCRIRRAFAPYPPFLYIRQPCSPVSSHSNLSTLAFPSLLIHPRFPLSPHPPSLSPFSSSTLAFPFLLIHTRFPLSPHPPCLPFPLSTLYSLCLWACMSHVPCHVPLHLTALRLSTSPAPRQVVGVPCIDDSDEEVDSLPPLYVGPQTSARICLCSDEACITSATSIAGAREWGAQMFGGIP